MTMPLEIVLEGRKPPPTPRARNSLQKYECATRELGCKRGRSLTCLWVTFDNNSYFFFLCRFLVFGHFLLLILSIFGSFFCLSTLCFLIGVGPPQASLRAF